ncbi:MAG TPA: hypothetical protein VF048_12405, partial [Gemmatimonadaceae bacterium]
MKVRAWAALPLLFGVATAVPAQTPPPAQALTLREALARADEAGYENRAAAGTAAAQRGQATAALRGILPSVR